MNANLLSLLFFHFLNLRVDDFFTVFKSFDFVIEFVVVMLVVSKHDVKGFISHTMYVILLCFD